MSGKEFARRTEIIVKIDGVDISTDMNKYLLQLRYTDNEEDKTDDLRISVDDREEIWINKWFPVSESDTKQTVEGSGSVSGYAIGDTVNFSGGTHYISSTAAAPTGGNRTAGTARITNIAKGAAHPYHLIGESSNVYGWVDVSQISSSASLSSESGSDSGNRYTIGDIVDFSGGTHYVSSTAVTPTGGNRTAGTAKITNISIEAAHPYHLIGVTSNVYGWVDVSQISSGASSDSKNGGGTILGAEIAAVIVQKNWESDGKDKVLDCGIFEIDSLDASGPPGQASIKATSLPHTANIRNEKKSRAWENVKLSTIASEIAQKNNMKCMFESAYDPYYTRREQVQISDIVFLQGLCKDAGISLKASARFLILFDAADYEKKDAVRAIKRGSADIKSYRFSASANDTKYSKCHVIYTNPQNNQTIEYTYTPRDSDTSGQVLEINEKVNTREEARQLAMKRLRQKNKSECSAEFSLVGDTALVAGVNVEVEGFGMFDEKYIIETATHNVTASGYTTQIKLRRVLEGY
ncbi:MAG: contractile injection system protein, VgrG/Pvc8 family [Ruminococcus sp.]|nr:contractile injection system protein, VgrG/Pvc8 family [Ruminococcus sp.]